MKALSSVPRRLPDLKPAWPCACSRWLPPHPGRWSCWPTPPLTGSADQPTTFAGFSSPGQHLDIDPIGGGHLLVAVTGGGG